MWSIPVPCSQPTYITCSTLTSQVFIDALTASSHGNLPCLLVPDSSSEQLNTILNHKQHIQIHIQNITVHWMGQVGLSVKTAPLVAYSSDRHYCKLKFILCGDILVNGVRLIDFLLKYTRIRIFGCSYRHWSKILFSGDFLVFGIRLYTVLDFSVWNRPD
jgi:hypothetical protein